MSGDHIRLVVSLALAVLATAIGAGGADPRHVSCIIVDPANHQTVYLVGSEPEDHWTGVYKTSDGGAHWRRVARPWPAYADGIRLVLDPTHPSTLLAAVESTPAGAHGYEFIGLWRTTSSGSNWTKLTAPTPSEEEVATTAFVLHPADSSRLYLAFESDMFTSSDGGMRWSRIEDDALRWRIVMGLAVDPRRPGTLYALMGRHFDSARRLYRTQSFGSSWERVGRGLPADLTDTLAVDPIRAGIIWAGSAYRGVFRSEDRAALRRHARRRVQI